MTEAEAEIPSDEPDASLEAEGVVSDAAASDTKTSAAESPPVDAPEAEDAPEATGGPYRKRARKGSKALVVIRELTKSFLHMGRALEVLKGIDLEIHEGEVVAIVGKSGAGKSTLLQCIGTLDMPTTGIIRIGDDYLVGLSRADLARTRNRMIGFVFQFHHLLPEFNALENVMMPGLIQGLARSTVEKRARELLSDVGLDHRITHRPGELSGGEQQRVALARALLLKPKLILADEPTGNLDTATSDAIHNLFFEINQKHGTTIVVVTHNTKLAESMPRVIRMLDGRVEHDTDPPGSTFEVDTAILERSRALAKVTYAGFWTRAAARILDIALLSLLGAAAFVVATVLRTGLGAADDASSKALLLVLGSLVNPLTLVTLWFGGGLLSLVAQGVGEWVGGGATLGKQLFGLRVRMENLDKPRVVPALMRNALVVIDGLFFGLVAFLGVRSSLLRQRFGDGLAQTVVVDRKTLPPGVSTGGAWGGVLVSLLLVMALYAALAMIVAPGS